MKLLEREKELGELIETLNRASDGQGSLVAVLGEAGIGKSSLIRAFLEEAGSEARVLRGFCDDLGIAEPLSVLRDIARDAEIDLPMDLTAPGVRTRTFSEVFEKLTVSDGPTVVFVEDVHWADDATVDFLRYLSRRVAGTSIMVILTARTDEARGRNIVRRIIGDGAAGDTKRMQVKPLSQAIVSLLAMEAGRDPVELNDVTAGNAFFVTELLNNRGGTHSATVQEAVMARVERLNEEAQEALKAVAVFPRQATSSQVSEILDFDPAPCLDACVDLGLLVLDGSAFKFRHVLARQAVLSEMRTSRRIELNSRLFDLLENEGHASASRLLYHAREAQIDDAVQRLAVTAANEAAKLGARREAAEYYRVAVLAEGIEAAAGLLEEAAYACHLVGQDSEAIEFQTRANEIYLAEKDQIRIGDGLRRRSRFYWSNGAFVPARVDARDAVEHLSRIRGPELAMAHSNLAQVFMLNREYNQVRKPAEAAIEIAEELHDREILCHALNNLAAAVMFTDTDRARQEMARSLELAFEIGHADHAARAFVNATYMEMYLCQFDAAKSHATRGIDYCREEELDGYRVYLTGALALVELGLGEFDSAWEHAQTALRYCDSFEIGLYRHPASVATIKYQVRKGIPLDQAEIAYLDTFRSNETELQRLIPYAECMAEHAWMTGEGVDDATELLITSIDWANLQEVVQTAHVWLKRLKPEHNPEDCSGFLDCYRRELEGDHDGASDAWNSRVAPYEQALSLAQGPEANRKRAADIFDQLDAEAASRRVRATLTRSGAKRSSQPRASTLNNPAGLTKRQIQVLICLEEGLSNADIADKLFISPKTVDHHVSAILTKLGVRTRAAAVVKARSFDLNA